MFFSPLLSVLLFLLKLHHKWDLLIVYWLLSLLCFGRSPKMNTISSLFVTPSAVWAYLWTTVFPSKTAAKGWVTAKPITLTSVITQPFKKNLNHLCRPPTWHPAVKPPTQNTSCKLKNTFIDSSWWWTSAQRLLFDPLTVSQCCFHLLQDRQLSDWQNVNEAAE